VTGQVKWRVCEDERAVSFTAAAVCGIEGNNYEAKPEVVEVKPEVKKETSFFKR